MRRSVRLDVSFPVVLESGGTTVQGKLVDVSRDGAACLCENRLDQDAPVSLEVGLLDPTYRASGKIVWCQPRGDQYVIALDLDEPAADDRAYVVETMWRIEEYRTRIQRDEGRDLSIEDAVREWQDRRGRRG